MLNRMLVGPQTIETKHGPTIIRQEPVVVDLPQVSRANLDNLINYISGLSEELEITPENFYEFLLITQNVLGSAVKFDLMEKLLEYSILGTNLGAILLVNNSPPNLSLLLRDMVDLFDEILPYVQDIVFLKPRSLKISHSGAIQSNSNEELKRITIYRRLVDKNFVIGDIMAYGYELKSHFSKFLLMTYDGKEIYNAANDILHYKRCHWLMGNEVDNKERLKVQEIL